MKVAAMMLLMKSTLHLRYWYFAQTQFFNDMTDINLKEMIYAERMREKGESENSIRKDVRAMMKARFRRMKQKMRKVNSLAGDDPQYVKAVYDARRIPLDTQKAAMLMFEERNGRELDLSKTEDLQELIKIAISQLLHLPKD